MWKSLLTVTLVLVRSLTSMAEDAKCVAGTTCAADFPQDLVLLQRSAHLAGGIILPSDSFTAHPGKSCRPVGSWHNDLERSKGSSVEECLEKCLANNFANLPAGQSCVAMVYRSRDNLCIYRTRYTVIDNANGRTCYVLNGATTPTTGPSVESSTASPAVVMDADRRNCQMSEWSAWGKCSVSCGMGQITRHRSIIKEPQGTGKPCGQLEQVGGCGHKCPAGL